MITSFLPLYFILIVSLISIWLIGALLISLAKAYSASWLNTFIALTCGLSIIISIYAAWATKAQTVMLLLPLFLGLALYYYKFSVPTAASAIPLPAIRSMWQPSRLTQVAVLLLAGTFFFVVRTAFHNSWPGYVSTALQDTVFYSKTTYTLTVQGVETEAINPLAGANQAPQTYHYFDLWVNTLLAKITTVPALLLLDIVVYAMLLTIFFIGFLALYNGFFKNIFFITLLALCSVFTCDTYWPLFNNTFLQGFYTSLIPLYPKLLPVAIFLLLGFQFVLRGKYAAAAWVWAATSLAYTVVAPSICAGGGALVLYQLVRKKLDWQAARQSMSAYVVAAVWIGGFYFLSGRHASGSASYTPSYLGYLPKLNEIKTSINYFIGICLSQVAFYIVNIVIIALLILIGREPLQKIWQQNESVVVAVLLFMLAAVAVGTLLKKATDGFQLWMNLLLPLIVIGINILLAAALQHARAVHFYWVSLVLVLLVAYNLQLATKPPFYPKRAITHHDRAFIKTVAEAEPSLSEVGTIFLGDADYSSIFSLNSGISTIGTYLSLVRNNATLVSLSATQFDQPKLQLPFEGDTALARHLIVSEPLTQFVRQERQAGQNRSLPASQLAFLQRNHINFICASPAAKLPSEIQAIVRREFKDPASGQRLYLLAIPAHKTPAVEDRQHVRWMW